MSIIVRAISRRFQGLLFLGALVALWAGGAGTWHGLRHRSPTPVDLAANPTQEIPDHVALKNIHLNVMEAVTERRAGESNLYVPVRPKGAPQNSPVRVLLKSANRELLDALAKSKGKDDASAMAAALPLLLKLAEQSEASGMLTGTFDVTTKLESDLRRMIPTLDRDFKIVVEGDKPSLLRGLGYLGLAVGLFFGFALVSPGSNGTENAAPPPLPPTA